MYRYKGITTNNLKNISVKFEDHEIIYIGGASGSGKSSLAFDTIVAISEDEYGSIIKDNKSKVKYSIEEYDSVLVAAALKQLNFNVNPRSTILTYFGLYKHITNILSYYTGLSAESFSLNGPCRCRKCNGIGYVNAIDEKRVVDVFKTLKEGPFKCWNKTYADFFSKLLHNFCEEENIDENNRFIDLPKSIQDRLLYGKGKKKYKINYKVSGKTRTKTTEYLGPIIGMNSKRNDMFNINVEKYSKSYLCPICEGSRITNDISSKVVLENIDVKFILTKGMDEIEPIINKIKIKCKNKSVKKSCDWILKFIFACKRLNISYLNFSRSISTLSGGELQRLRMAQLMLGKLKNILIVLDEPTSSLNYDEIDSVISIISELKLTNTVIVVDHHNKIIDIADRVYYLGPKGGVNGGQFITKEDYEKICKESTDIKLSKKIFEKGKEIEIKTVSLSSDYVNYDANLKIFMNELNGISGISGIGKTTILRDILPYQLEGYKYITQKPIKGNRSSTVASYVGILDSVRKYYALKTGENKEKFSLSQKGACPKCNGKGIIVMGDFYEEELFFECEECNGTGYIGSTLEYVVDGLNIYEFLEQSIDEIIEKNSFISKKFEKKMKLLQKLGLGHLSLNQKTSSLSGGENQRIKLSQALGEEKTKIYGLDEPSKGLGNNEISKVISVIYENIEKNGKTFIVSEHNPEFLKWCTSVSELKKENDKVYIDVKFNK